MRTFLVDDLFRSGRPCDRSTVTVPMCNERLDRLVESLHGFTELNVPHRIVAVQLVLV